MIATIKVYGSTILQVYPNPSQSQYSAIVKDEMGNVLSIKPIWTVDPVGKGISIDANGLIRVVPPIYISSVTIIASIGDVSGKRVVAINGSVVQPPAPPPVNSGTVSIIPKYNDIVLSNPYMGIMPQARKALVHVDGVSSDVVYLGGIVNNRTVGRKFTVLNADYSERGTLELVSEIQQCHLRVKVLSGSTPVKGCYLVNYTNPIRHVYVYALWRELETQEGVYDFNAIEKLNHIPYWRAKGIKCVFKLVSDYPVKGLKHADIPEWLLKKINYDGTYYNVASWGGVQGFFPNYANPIMISAHDKLFKALGDKYNNDDLVYMFSMGSLGYWGEFHGGPLFPKIPVTEQYMMHYVKYLPNKFLSVRRNYSTFTKTHGIGYFNDGVKPGGQQVYDWGLNWANNGYTEDGNGDKHPPDPDIINRTPVDGEPIVWDDTQDLFWSDNQYPTMVQTMRDLKMNSFHVTPDMVERKCGATQKNWDDFLKRLGYRFYIKSVDITYSSSKVSVKLSVDNLGWSKFWFKYNIEISLVDADGKTVVSAISSEDIRTWIGTKTFSTDIIKELQVGEYKVCIAVLNPKTNLPAVDFANFGRRADGRYELTSFKLEGVIVIPKATSVEISGNSTVQANSIVKYVAIVKDEDGNVMQGESIVWSITPSPLTIGTDGTVNVSINAVSPKATIKAVVASNPNVYGVYDISIVKPNVNNAMTVLGALSASDWLFMEASMDDTLKQKIIDSGNRLE